MPSTFLPLSCFLHIFYAYWFSDFFSWCTNEAFQPPSPPLAFCSSLMHTQSLSNFSSNTFQSIDSAVQAVPLPSPFFQLWRVLKKLRRVIKSKGSFQSEKVREGKNTVAEEMPLWLWKKRQWRKGQILINWFFGNSGQRMNSLTASKQWFWNFQQRRKNVLNEKYKHEKHWFGF